MFSGGGFINAATFEEVVVETGAGSAEATTGGVQINIIPKDGGNTFSGSLSAEYTGPSLTSDNVNDELRARGLTAAPSVKSYHDIGGGLGGPIKQDKMWFFTAARFEDRAIYQAGNYYNKRQGSPFYEADLSRQAYNHDSKTPRSAHGRSPRSTRSGLLHPAPGLPMCVCHFGNDWGE